MLKTLDVLFYVFGAAAIIALPFFAVNHFKYSRVRAANRSSFRPLPAKFPMKSLVFLAAPILLVFAIAHIMTS